MEAEPLQNDQNEQSKKDILEEFGTVHMAGDAGNICTLTIIGQIEGHQVLPETAKTTKYEHILPLLASIEQSEQIEGVLLLLNTVGGDIEAGLAIAELIAGMKKPSVSLVLGGGHSIGVPLAVCAKKSFIARTASMTIHPVRMTGTVIGAPQTYQYMQRIREQIVDFVTANSKVSRETFLSYMMATGEIASDVGTVIYGQEAVDCGLIDRVGSLSDALACLRQMISRQKKRAASRAVSTSKGAMLQ
ncbi:MAG: peptidase S14 [Ruminococcaceae bacterium]|nr:peptidase S14 [Oscillospiraceae bacterium]